MCHNNHHIIYGLVCISLVWNQKLESIILFSVLHFSLNIYVYSLMQYYLVLQSKLVSI